MFCKHECVDIILLLHLAEKDIIILTFFYMTSTNNYIHYGSLHEKNCIYTLHTYNSFL